MDFNPVSLLSDVISSTGPQENSLPVLQTEKPNVNLDRLVLPPLGLLLVSLLTGCPSSSSSGTYDDYGGEPAYRQDTTVYGSGGYGYQSGFGEYRSSHYEGNGGSGC